MEISASELSELVKIARDEGYERGYSVGHATGFNEGQGSVARGSSNLFDDYVHITYTGIRPENLVSLIKMLREVTKLGLIPCKRFMDGVGMLYVPRVAAEKIAREMAIEGYSNGVNIN